MSNVKIIDYCELVGKEKNVNYIYDYVMTDGFRVMFCG